MTIQVGKYLIELGTGDILLFVVILGIIITLLIVGLTHILSSPFDKPSPSLYTHQIDITGRKNSYSEDKAIEMIEEWINNEELYTDNDKEYLIFQSRMKNWYKTQKEKLENCKHFKKRREMQFYECVNSYIDKDKGFYQVFAFTRTITKYKQINYHKIPYQETQVEYKIRLSSSQYEDMYYNLKEIGFETTTKKYFSKNQRGLMTKELRDEILKRDNYTCRCCGNSTYREPNLLLEIDHIIPVSKGGKSVPSNLQTLCWKCNREKSNK